MPQITTIHSFCLSVIRSYFHTIELDPAFRIGDEGELDLLKADVLEAMLEKHYEKAEDSFIQFVETYATGRDDSGLMDLILQCYDFSRSYPWPGSMVKKYSETVSDGVSFSNRTRRLDEIFNALYSSADRRISDNL